MAQPKNGKKKKWKKKGNKCFFNKEGNFDTCSSTTWPTRLLCPWDFSGKDNGVGCHFLLQGIFLTQGSNLGLPHCRQILYPLGHQGSPHKVIKITGTESRMAVAGDWGGPQEVMFSGFRGSVWEDVKVLGIDDGDTFTMM